MPSKAAVSKVLHSSSEKGTPGTAQLTAIIQKTKHKGRRRQWKETAVLVAAVGDIIFFLAGMGLAYYVRFETGLSRQLYRYEGNIVPSYSGYFIFGLALFLTIHALVGAYRYETVMQQRRANWKLLKSLSLWLGFFLLLTLTFKMDPVLSQAFVWLCLPSSGLCLVLWRLIFNTICSTEPYALILRQRILVVGWNQEAVRLSKAIEGDPGQPYSIVGCLPSANGAYSVQPPNWVEQLGTNDQLESVIQTGNIDIVLVADLEPQMQEMIAMSQLCERHMVQFKIIPTFFQILLTALMMENVSGIPVLGVERVPLAQIGNRAIKRMVDIVGAVVGLLLFGPVILLFSILVYRESPGPVIFSQPRRGRYGRLFRMYKLRSMKIGAHRTDHLSQSTFRNDPRLLKIGKFMRRYNIDELPQFWNVLKGEMSLVGPRPERISHADRLEYSIPYYNARQNIKPGLTGWAQIHGYRGDTDLNERVRFDLYYIENWNIWIDFYIMAMTLIRNKNAY